MRTSVTRTASRWTSSRPSRSKPRWMRRSVEAAQQVLGHVERDPARDLLVRRRAPGTSSLNRWSTSRSLARRRGLEPWRCRDRAQLVELLPDVELAVHLDRAQLQLVRVLLGELDLQRLDQRRVGADGRGGGRVGRCRRGGGGRARRTPRRLALALGGLGGASARSWRSTPRDTALLVLGDAACGSRRATAARSPSASRRRRCRSAPRPRRRPPPGFSASSSSSTQMSAGRACCTGAPAGTLRRRQPQLG